MPGFLKGGAKWISSIRRILRSSLLQVCMLFVNVGSCWFKARDLGSALWRRWLVGTALLGV